jgi:hypothetical protein
MASAATGSKRSRVRVAPGPLRKLFPRLHFGWSGVSFSLLHCTLYDSSYVTLQPDQLISQPFVVLLDPLLHYPERCLTVPRRA